MSLRRTGLLALVTAALAAFVYFYELPGGGVAEEATRLFPELSAEDIDSIALVDGLGRRLRASRVPAGWRVVEPVSAPGDPAVLDRMAHALAEMASAGRIDDPADAAVYGLADPATRIVFVSDGREYLLSLGREAPLGGNVYASVADGPLAAGAEPIYMISTEAALAFDVGLDALRDHRLLDFAPDDVLRLRLAARDADGGFEARLEREDGGWTISTPGPFAADPGAVGRLLSDLSLLRAEGFVDDPGPEAQAAVADPDFAVEIETASGAQRLDLGAAPADAPHLRFARGQDGRFYRVRAALVEHFPTRLLALRDRRVLRFDPASVRALQVDFGAESTLRAVPDEVLLGALSKLDAVDVVAESLGAAEQKALELDPARVRIRVLGPDDVRLADLRLGRLDPERGMVARAGDGETIWRLDPGLDTVLPSQPGDLRRVEEDDDS